MRTLGGPSGAEGRFKRAAYVQGGAFRKLPCVDRAQFDAEGAPMRGNAGQCFSRGNRARSRSSERPTSSAALQPNSSTAPGLPIWILPSRFETTLEACMGPFDYLIEIFGGLPTGNSGTKPRMPVASWKWAVQSITAREFETERRATASPGFWASPHAFTSPFGTL